MLFYIKLMMLVLSLKVSTSPSIRHQELLLLHSNHKRIFWRDQVNSISGLDTPMVSKLTTKPQPSPPHQPPDQTPSPSSISLIRTIPTPASMNGKFHSQPLSNHAVSIPFYYFLSTHHRVYSYYYFYSQINWYQYLYRLNLLHLCYLRWSIPAIE